MQLRLLDEVIDLGAHGVMLLCMDAAAASSLRSGISLIDARGNRHTLAAVTMQDGVFMLHLPEERVPYFERLFRDIRVDATLFHIEEDASCP